MSSSNPPRVDLIGSIIVPITNINIESHSVINEVAGAMSQQIESKKHDRNSQIQNARSHEKRVIAPLGTLPVEECVDSLWWCALFLLAEVQKGYSTGFVETLWRKWELTPDRATRKLS